MIVLGGDMWNITRQNLDSLIELWFKSSIIFVLDNRTRNNDQEEEVKNQIETNEDNWVNEEL